MRLEGLDGALETREIQSLSLTRVVLTECELARQHPNELDAHTHHSKLPGLCNGVKNPAREDLAHPVSSGLDDPLAFSAP
jgi:hypothetical protein